MFVVASQAVAAAPAPVVQAEALATTSAARGLLELLVRPSYACSALTSFGPEGDGGYVLCADAAPIVGIMDAPAIDGEPCVVFSFGINHNFGCAYSHSFTLLMMFARASTPQPLLTRFSPSAPPRRFENELVGRGCEVHGFDPTVAAEATHRFHFHQVGLGARHELQPALGRVDTLKHLRELASGPPSPTRRRLSLLKVDIEGGEWDAFDAMGEAELDAAADHLVIEFHLDGFGVLHANYVAARCIISGRRFRSPRLLTPLLRHFLLPSSTSCTSFTHPRPRNSLSCALSIGRF